MKIKNYAIIKTNNCKIKTNTVITKIVNPIIRVQILKCSSYLIAIKNTTGLDIYNFSILGTNIFFSKIPNGSKLIFNVDELNLIRYEISINKIKSVIFIQM